MNQLIKSSDAMQIIRDNEDRIFDVIMGRIKSVAENGYSMVQINERITPEIKARLYAMGYRVDIGNYYSMVFWHIPTVIDKSIKKGKKWYEFWK